MKPTPARRMHTPLAILTTIELRLIKAKRDYEYYEVLQKEYEVTKKGEKVIEW